MYNISFYLNGKEINTTVPSNLNLLSFIRNHLNLTGTKEGCSEGDCGACTVVIGEVYNGKVIYNAVNSCLIPVLRLHGKHLITIEGLGNPDNLHPIQQVLLDYHGIQCGYCTPGVIMSLFGLFLKNKQPSESDIYHTLEGNLCRCTGYESIRKAALSVARQFKNNHDKLIPPYFVSINKKLLSFDNKILWIPLTNDVTNNYMVPKSIREAINILDKDSCKIIDGGTDLMVDINIKKHVYDKIIDLSEIKEIKLIRQKNHSIIVGAGTTFSDILKNNIIQSKLPLVNTAISQVGSQQIRNIATIGGNIGNVSPVADLATALIALDTKLMLKSKSGQRKVNLADYYLGYKTTVLRPNEIVFAVEIPTKNVLTSFIKGTKRKAVDIASVNSAICLEVEDRKVNNARLALGGVAPYPVLAKKACSYLKGKIITKDIIDKTSSIALAEIQPISDLRGSKEFRLLLVRNQIIKHFMKLFPELYE